MKKTAGTWDPADWPTYFVAVNLQHPEITFTLLDQMLIPVNEISDTDAHRKMFERLVLTKRMFLDSGVYALCNRHAEAHGLSMDEALGLPPSDLDGFEELFKNYCGIATKHGDMLWGYIEIDQGGRENKIKTRARLEKLGLRPIPVYHPFNDGWDYFDHLAENYDRICFGNVVMADRDTRKKLIATAWERRRKYPHLWVHALGLTPSDLTVAFPINSCDSSTWVGIVRWAQHESNLMTKDFDTLGSQFIYRAGDRTGPFGYDKTMAICSYDSRIVERTMKNIVADQRRVLGADIGLFE